MFALLDGVLIVFCPELEMVGEAFVSLVEIVEDDCLLSLVPFPPFVGHFLVGTRVLFSCCSCLSSSSWSPVPEALTGSDSVDLEEVVFTDLLEICVVSTADVSRNLFNFALFG